MLLTKRELPVLVVNLLYIPAFTALALSRRNYEFVLYVVVVLAVAAWIVAYQRRVRLGMGILWGLTAWGLLHMAGGNVSVGDGVLYEVVLLPIIPELEVLRYDHFVHFFGFGVATLLCHHLLQPHLQDVWPRPRVLWFLVVLMGCGLGAMNEVVEYIAVLTMPKTEVGGYDNTLLDLVFNLLGATAAATWLCTRSVRDAVPLCGTASTRQVAESGDASPSVADSH